MAFLFVIALWFQTNKILIEKQNERLRNETRFFIQNILPSYINGDINAVFLVVKKFGYTHLLSMPQHYQVISSQNDDMLGVKIFRTDKKIGFSLSYFGDTFIVVKNIDTDFWEENRIKIFFFPILLILIILQVFSFTLLTPLNNLIRAIKEFTKGNYDIKLDTQRKDEVGDLISAFNLMRGKISKMLKSRELILRNIGHELKTPLAKMKLILALQKTKSEDYIKLQHYVADMQKISDNMLEFERVNSGNIVIQNEEFLSETLVFEALSSFFDEEDKIQVDFGENFYVKGDLRLLSVALKNLIENALKYTNEEKIFVNCVKNNISVKNKGEKLAYDIDYYLEPFYREARDSTISGHGLGLSIVNEILSLHHYRLEYNYSEGYHIFSIIF